MAKVDFASKVSCCAKEQYHDLVIVMRVQRFILYGPEQLIFSRLQTAVCWDTRGSSSLSLPICEGLSTNTPKAQALCASWGRP